MKNLSKRLNDLERAGAGALYLHFPDNSDDHAAAWANVPHGSRVGVIHFPGLNDGAVEAFNAAGPPR